MRCTFWKLPHPDRYHGITLEIRCPDLFGRRGQGHGAVMFMEDNLHELWFLVRQCSISTVSGSILLVGIVNGVNISVGNDGGAAATCDVVECDDVVGKYATHRLCSSEIKDQE